MGRIRKNSLSVRTTAAFLSCISTLAPTLSAADTTTASPSPSPTSSLSAQAQSYQDAINLGKATIKGDVISIGIYAATTAACGMTCNLYQTNLKKKDPTSLNDAINTLTPALTSAALACTNAIEACETFLSSSAGAAAAAAPAGCTPAVVGNGPALKAWETKYQAQLKVVDTDMDNLSKDSTQADAATVSQTDSQSALGKAMGEKGPDINGIHEKTNADINAYVSALKTLSTDFKNAQLQPCVSAGTTIDSAVAKIVPANTTYLANIETVKKGGLACQGFTLGAGVADVALATQIQDNGKSVMTGLVGLAAGEAINYKGLSAAVEEIKGNNKQNSEQLAETMGKSACWSMLFSSGEMAYHTYDMMKTNNTVKGNEDSLNALQSNPSAWNWANRFWAKLSSFTLPTAVADTPPSGESLVRACPSGISTPDALLGCAAERDPVIKSAVNNPKNPIGQIFSVLDSQGIASSSFLSTTPPNFEQVAGILSRGDSGKQAYLADAFSSLSINGETIASLGPITLLNPERNLASSGVQQAPSLLAQVPAVTSPAVSSSSDVSVEGFSSTDSRNIFQRISDRYQIATPNW